MRFHELTIEAFGPFVEQKKINFQTYNTSSLFLIYGRTGAGKTTLLDAITYVLYGFSADGLRTGKELRSLQAPLENLTQITLTFNWGGESYTVWRQAELERPKKRGEGVTKQPPQAKLWKDRDLIETQSTRVTEAIEKLLTMRFQQFRQTILLPQGEFRQLLLAEGKQRQHLLESLFQTEYYQKLEEHFKKTYQKECQELQLLKEKKEWLFKKADLSTLLDIKLRKSQRQLTVKKLKIEREYLKEKKKTLWATYQEKNKAYSQWLEYKQLREDLLILQKKESYYKQKKQRVDKALELTSIEPHLLRKKEWETTLQRLTKERATLPKEGGYVEEHTLVTMQRTIQETQQALDSKQRHEALIETINKKRQQLKKLEKAAQHTQQHTLALLAKELSSGEPCPLCGSLEHPKLASTSSKEPSAQAFETLQKQIDLLKNALIKLEQEKIRFSHVDVSLETLKEQKTHYEQVRDKRERGLVLKVKKEHLTKEVALLEQRLNTCNEELEIHIKKLGYASLDTLLSNRIPYKNLQSEQKELQTYLTSKQLIEQQLTKCQVTQQVEEPEIQPLHTLDQQIEKNLQHLTSTEQHLSEDSQLLEELSTLINQTQEREERYALLGTLTEAALGKNPKKLSLHRYILSVLFDEVLFHATAHLEKITLHRYSLHRFEETARFELQVFDHFTGHSRPVSTLSGGESFLASLSLALGLSDAIQHYSGGRQLETFFIDEGFGSLDPQALDQVLQTLERLSQKGRTIGIITHLEEIKERIPTHLEL